MKISHVLATLTWRYHVLATLTWRYHTFWQHLCKDITLTFWQHLHEDITHINENSGASAEPWSRIRPGVASVRDCRRFEGPWRPGYSQCLESDVLKASGELISNRLTPSIFVCSERSMGHLCLSTMLEHLSAQAAKVNVCLTSAVCLDACLVTCEGTDVTDGQDLLQQLVRRHP